MLALASDTKAKTAGAGVAEAVSQISLDPGSAAIDVLPKVSPVSARFSAL